MGNHDISITWGSDGAAIFKSSSYSIWPLTMMVNELPYPLRRKHVLMGGLWFGNGKPHFPTFLKPVIEELNVLSSVGLNLEDEDGNIITRKVFPGALTCESVARCQLQELTQYNGRHGCSWCYHSGEQVAKGNGHTNVYPSLQDELPQKRDHQSYICDAQRALDTNSSVNGVKNGVST
ncbi:uncharacterized protein LOC117108598 [Anneissia japonica]|uniref:uncharacterized protein LOC117108598 n=1 Tax=Anneissia japonica TaxID=1529436 RepID=UPI0014256852|nr:uncharacterized protein LOC117108598 [Anneissia japonica]